MSQRQLDPRQLDAAGLPDGTYALVVVNGEVTALGVASTTDGTDIPVGPTAPPNPEINDLWVRTP